MYSQLAQHYSSIFPLNPLLVTFLEGELDAGGSLLDLGCGTGELCSVLLQRGYNCTGIDLDEEMINIAVERGGAESFQAMNIHDISSFQRSYDLVLSTGNVISHIDTARIQNTINDIKTILSPTGKWIYQIINWDRYLSKGYTFPVLEREDGHLKFYREYTGNENEVQFSIRLELDGREVYQGDSILYPLPIEEHLAMNSQAGFMLKGMYRTWDRKPFRAEEDSSVIFLFGRDSLNP